MLVQCSSVQSDSRRHLAKNTTPPERLKRSERLRDRRVHYTDMIHGIHPRHGTDAEPKPDETGLHHHTVSRASLPHRESSGRTGGRSVSTDSHTKPKTAPVEPQQSTVAVNYRRQSMELRSGTAERQISQVMVKPATPHPLATGPLLTHSAGRHHRAQQEEIRRGSVESTAGGAVECTAEQPTTRPAPSHRHRGGARHRRRMAARRRSKLLSLPANPSPDKLLNSNSSTVTVAEDCSQQNIATADSYPVDESKVSSPAKSVKFVDSGDASVLNVASVDNNVVQKSPGCRDSTDAAVNKTSVSVVSALPYSHHGGIDASRLKHELLQSNYVRVMHSGRVGRRRHSQEGIVLLDRYVSADAACICCCSCSEMLSITEFVRHMHHTYPVDVRSDRRLGPCGVVTPEWHEFQHRRTEFAVGPSYSNTPVCLPPVDHLTQTTDSETAVDEVMKSTNVESLPSVSPPPVPVMNEVRKSSSDDSSSIGIDFRSQPLESVVTAASSPAVADEVEPRVTRSRSISTSHAAESSSPNVPPLHKPSPSVATSPLRHSNRSCKRARMDSRAMIPVRHASDVDSVGSRLELRPRPPPRTTAHK